MTLEPIEAKSDGQAPGRLSVGFEVKFAENAQDGTFSGYGSIFDIEDYGGDVIKRGAFRATLKEWSAKNKLPKMLLQHGGGWAGSANDMVPIGKWTKMSEDETGLRVEGRLFTESERGKMIYAAMREGELDGLSIGYRAKEFTLGTKPDEPYRTIKRLDLMEVSVVLFGMNPVALVDAVKSDIDDLATLSDVEKFLREAGGFSRKTATALVSRVARIAQREAGASKSLDDLLEQIRSTSSRIR
ncbi:HK97 family phage prohead protease [Ancylobacter sp. 3268]|uniref:HK97 family phage prohead protease n=1 Tax=Ancylobacter sp. 3268 TaxID=2817752 RepID=UPI002865194B|nr:HK97 family phage prohead protease [Ancylobacter sp. 3268]MDR6953794.1 HK97 family phage prohead protease [Ancylobacter sp. 3268]